MANRSNKTVLSVRIAPHAKSNLDALAALRGVSLPQLIESLADEAVRNTATPKPPLARDGVTAEGESGVVSLKVMLDAIWTPDAELYKLRLYTVMPRALNSRDEIAAQVVTMSPIFKGFDRIFTKEAADLIKLEPPIPTVSMERVKQFWPLLIEYARFLENNSLTLSFHHYIDMLHNSGELDAKYEAILY